jgi:hypothetical protein
MTKPGRREHKRAKCCTSNLNPRRPGASVGALRVRADGQEGQAGIQCKSPRVRRRAAPKVSAPCLVTTVVGTVESDPEDRPKRVMSEPHARGERAAAQEVQTRTSEWSCPVFGAPDPESAHVPSSLPSTVQ